MRKRERGDGDIKIDRKNNKIYTKQSKLEKAKEI